MAKIILLVSIIMTTKKTPIFTLITIVSITIMISIVIVSINMGHWIRILLIIVYIRGVIVLFMYATSLSPFEKNIRKKLSISVMTIIIITVVLSYRKRATIKMIENQIQRVFSTNFTIIIILVIILIIIASTLPKISMNINKGLKASK